MKIEINGEAREVPESLMLDDLIAHLELSAPERLAIEHNRQVVRRAEWSRTEVKENDRIEIVHFVGGGETEKMK